MKKKANVLESLSASLFSTLAWVIYNKAADCRIDRTCAYFHFGYRL